MVKFVNIFFVLYKIVEIIFIILGLKCFIKCFIKVVDIFR